MKTISNRKSILLSLIAVFFVIYVFQLIFTGKSKVKVIELKDTEKQPVNKILLGELELTREEDKWYVGEKKYLCDYAAIDTILSSIKELKLLGKVTSKVSDAERYGLNDESKLTVKAFSGDTLLRTIYVGKNSSTNTQSYVSYDNKQTIYAAQNALRDVFTKTEDTLRSKVVYDVDSSEITKVDFKGAEGDFVLVKKAVQPGEELPDSVWSVESSSADFTGKLDDSKVDNWVSRLSRVECEKWTDEDRIGLDESDYTVKIFSGDNATTLYLKKGADEDSNMSCLSTASKYGFELSEYIGKRYTSTLADLAQ